jgi:parallel beta-helix repeat protein
VRRGLLFLVVLSLFGCSEDGGGNGSIPTACDHKLADGTCVGVTLPDICGDTFCTGEATCSKVWHVEKDASGGDGSKGSPLGSLSDAAAKASSGECIALGPGSYDAARLEGGVSLLGAGASKVTISATGQPALAIEDGSGGLLRGVTLSSTHVGLRLRRMKGLRIEQVAVAKAAGAGIDARWCTGLELENVLVKEVGLLQVTPPDAGVPTGDAGSAPGDGDPANERHGIGLVLGKTSTAKVSASAVVKSGTQGVLVHGSDATLEGVLVAGSGRFGVALGCTVDSCPDTTRVERCTIDNSAGIGLLVQGGKLEAVENDIGNTSYHQGVGRNVQVQDGTQLLLEKNRVHHSKGQGLVIDDSNGKVLSNTVESNEGRGAVVQNVSTAPGLVFQDNQVTANERVGLAVLSSKSVTIQGGKIAGTKKRSTIIGPDSAKIGDGLQIATKSEIKVAKLKIEGNERFGVLVDDAETTIDDTTIKGGEQAVVVQVSSKATLNNVTDGAGVAITAKNPSTPYLLNNIALVSTLPIPLP